MFLNRFICSDARCLGTMPGMHRNNTRNPSTHTAVALAASAQALVIEQASAAGGAVPERRPSSRVQLVTHGEFEIGRAHV